MPTPVRTIARSISMLSIGLIASCLVGTAAAERRDCSSTKQSKQELSRTVSQPSNIPGHEMFQALRIDSQSSSNPDFNGVDQLVFGQVDHVYGTGDHRGHSINLHRNGDRSFTRWSGTHKTVAVDGGSWETTIVGRYEFTGGTGKFASIKGGGTYQGKLTPQGLTEQDTCQAEY